MPARATARTLADMPRHHLNAITAMLSAALVAVPLGACGSAGKPDYCNKRETLSNDVKALTDIKLEPGAVQSLKTQLQKIRKDAQAVVDSAKGDFPTETSDMQRTLSNLRTTVDNTSSSPTASDFVLVGKNMVKLADSVKAFTAAAGDKC
jgi:hypothetical protein